MDAAMRDEGAGSCRYRRAGRQTAEARLRTRVFLSHSVSTAGSVRRVNWSFRAAVGVHGFVARGAMEYSKPWRIQIGSKRFAHDAAVARSFIPKSIRARRCRREIAADFSDAAVPLLRLETPELTRRASSVATVAERRSQTPKQVCAAAVPQDGVAGAPRTTRACRLEGPFAASLPRTTWTPGQWRTGSRRSGPLGGGPAHKHRSRFGGRTRPAVAVGCASEPFTQRVYASHSRAWPPPKPDPSRTQPEEEPF